MQQAIDGDDPKGDPIILIDCTLVLEYEAKAVGDLPAANLRAFAETNGVFNAWPYWREFAQSMAARMGIPRLVIPVFRFPVKKTK